MKEFARNSLILKAIKFLRTSRLLAKLNRCIPVFNRRLDRVGCFFRDERQIEIALVTPVFFTPR